MSAPSRRERLVWWDEAGVEYESVTRSTGLQSPAGVPRRDRLVDVHDPAGHLVAVLRRPLAEDAPPFLFVHGGGGPRPMLALLDEGLGALVVSYDPDRGLSSAGVLGTPRETFDVDCPTCRAGYPLQAAQVRQAMVRTTRRTPRIALTAQRTG